jgi:ADP-heptose:LPS heptosyltransferase
MKQPGKSLRRIAWGVLKLPVSPRAFGLLVAGLCALRFIPRKKRRETEEIRRIFVSHPYSSVGDLILLIPFLERLRAEWPDAVVDIVVGDRAADLLLGVAGLNVIRLDRCDFFREPSTRRFPGLYAVFERYLTVFRFVLFYRRALQDYSYDLAVVPRWGSSQTWPAIYLAHLTRARRIVGYSSSVDGGGTASDVLLTTAVSDTRNEHESLRSLRLLTRAGVWAASSDEEATVNRPIPSLIRLAELSHDAEENGTPFPAAGFSPEMPYCIISPGATAAFRMWPAERMIRVMEALSNEFGLAFYLVGSARDADLCNSIAVALPGCTVSIAGKTSLLQLTRVLGNAQLFIGMDSGIAHIAGALGLSTIVLSPFPLSCNVDHPNSPVRFRPCGPRVRVLQPIFALPPCDPTCSFPGPHCIEQIQTEDVLQVAREQLEAGTTRRSEGN